MNPIEIQRALREDKNVYWKSPSYRVILHNEELYIQCGQSRIGIAWNEYQQEDFYINTKQ